MFLCRTDNHLIFPWKILSIGALGRTVQQFFEEVMLTSLKSNETGVETLEQLELSVTFLEKSRIEEGASNSQKCCGENYRNRRWHHEMSITQQLASKLSAGIKCVA